MERSKNLVVIFHIIYFLVSFSETRDDDDASSVGSQEWQPAGDSDTEYTKASESRRMSKGSRSTGHRFSSATAGGDDDGFLSDGATMKKSKRGHKGKLFVTYYF